MNSEVLMPRVVVAAVRLGGSFPGFSHMFCRRGRTAATTHMACVRCEDAAGACFHLRVPYVCTGMIDVTDNAVRQLRALVGAAAEKGLRIGIAKGGCSGLQYEMTLGEPQPGDTIVQRDGARFFVDSESASLLRGSTLDYHDALTGSGFQILNPNAARTCGCGSSFEPARPA